MNQEGPVSKIHLEKYTSWNGSRLKRVQIIPNVIAEQFKHNMRNKWVKALIVIAWVFTVFFPLLRASFGELVLLQDPNESPFMNWEDDFAIGERGWNVDEVFPIHRTIHENETVRYNITVVNRGDDFSEIRVFLGYVDPGWNTGLLEGGDNTTVWELVNGLHPGESYTLALIVWPQEDFYSDFGEVHVEGEFSGPEGHLVFFEGEQGLTKRVRTRTYRESAWRQNYDMTMWVEDPVSNISVDEMSSFRFTMTNTGLKGDNYTLWLEGFPEKWEYELKEIDPDRDRNLTFNKRDPVIHLEPNETLEFVLTYDPPKYPKESNYLAVACRSSGDKGLMGSVIHSVGISEIQEKDMTEDIFTKPAGGLYGFPIFIWFSLFLAAVVGSKAISTDLAEKSYTLYFSRPIKKFDYISIKYGSVAATMCMVTLVPVLVTYGGLILLSNVDTDYIVNHLWVWGAIIAHSMIITLLFASLAIAFSSLTARKFYAAFGLVIVYFLSAIISAIIVDDFHEDRGTMVSLHTSLEIVGTRIFRVSDITYDYNWEYNLYVLLTLVIISFIVVTLKIWRTELSE